MKQPAILEIVSVTKKFNNNSTLAVDNVSLTLQQGDLLGLLGPSGCGKTTLLRIIAGFEKVSQGQIKLAGQLVNSNNYWLPPEKRNTGMVFQDYALFPHLSVADNIAFGLKRKRGCNSKQIKQRVGEVLALVGLAGLEKRYPHELSGGQQQRIALARALAPQPALILLDEPLSNLDVQIRHRLREEIRCILKAAGTSAIFVTHDQEEALAISDQIAVMSQGKLEQIGTPESIYTQPASRFVAEFVTQANFLPAKKQGQVWTTEIGELKIPRSTVINNCDRADLMLRQEDIMLTPDENSAVVVKERQFLGREYRYCLETASGKRLHARTSAGVSVDIGTKVNLSVAAGTAKIFPINPCSKAEVPELRLIANK
ncbi:MAG: ABC transporter ATP-binding protein [Xenococcaceae cyanobacterium]